MARGHWLMEMKCWFAQQKNALDGVNVERACQQRVGGDGSTLLVLT